MGVVVRRYIDILTIIINFPYSTCTVYREMFVLKNFRVLNFRGVEFSLSGPSTKIKHARARVTIC